MIWSLNGSVERFCGGFWKRAHDLCSDNDDDGDEYYDDDNDEHRSHECMESSFQTTTGRNVDSSMFRYHRFLSILDTCKL